MPQFNKIADNVLKRSDAKPLEFETLADRVLGLGEAGIAKKVGQLTLGEPGLSDLSTRFSIANANTVQEKINAFKKDFPEGDLMFVPEDFAVLDAQAPEGTGPQGITDIPVESELGPAMAKDLIEKGVKGISIKQRPVLLFREDASRPFKKVDADTLEKFEPVADLIDFLGEDVYALGGEIIAGASSRGRSFIETLLRITAGGAAGEATSQTVQRMRDISDEETKQIVQRITEQGGLSALGVVLGVPGDKVIDLIRGKGLAKLSQERREALKAFEELGLELPTPGTIVDNPFIVRLEQQSAAISPNINRFAEENMRLAVEKLKSTRDPVAKSNFLDSLVDIQQRTENEIKRALRQKTKKIKYSDAGKGLQIGQREYDNVLKNNVDSAYEVARSIEEPIFNAENLIETAGDFLKGIPVSTRDGKLINARKLTPELTSLLKDIKKISPDIKPTKAGKKIVSATDQLRTFRSRLYDIRTKSKQDGDNVSASIANEVFSEINNILNNPQNTTELFRGAWNKANFLASNRFEILEKAAVIKLARTETPRKFASSLAQPGRFDDIRTIRASIPSKRFEKFQEAFKTDLIDDIENLTNRLNSFDNETLNLLMSKKEQNIFRNVAEQYDKIKKFDLKKLAEKHKNANEVMERIVKGDSQLDYKKMQMGIHKAGGKNSIEGKSIRAAIIDYAWNNSIKKAKNRYVLDPAAMKKTMQEIKKRKLDSLLTQNDRYILRRFDKIIDFLPIKSEVGASIAAQETVSQARSILRVSGGSELIDVASKLINILGVGKLMTSKAGRKLFFGTKDLPPSRYISTLSAMLTILASDMEVTEKEQ